MADDYDLDVDYDYYDGGDAPDGWTVEDARWDYEANDRVKAEKEEADWALLKHADADIDWGMVDIDWGRLRRRPPVVARRSGARARGSRGRRVAGVRTAARGSPRRRPDDPPGLHVNRDAGGAR